MNAGKSDVGKTWATFLRLISLRVFLHSRRRVCSKLGEVENILSRT